MLYATCPSCSWGPGDDGATVCPACGTSLVEDRSLDGAVAVVTGGGRGIGRRLAQDLTRAGARVAVTGRHATTLDDAVAAGDAALAVVMDVAVPDDVEQGFARVAAELGPVELLVNNAGISGPTDVPTWAAGADAWWRVLEVNVRGPQLCAAAVLPGMVERGAGRVVNLGSGIGFPGGPPTASAYGASKAALHHLTGSLAATVAGTGVTVLAFSPGMVRTDMTAGIAGMADVPDEAWSPVEASGDLVVRIAHGDLDALAGRLVNVRQPTDALLARLDDVLEDDLLVVDYRDAAWAPWAG